MGHNLVLSDVHVLVAAKKAPNLLMITRLHDCKVSSGEFGAYPTISSYFIFIFFVLLMRFLLFCNVLIGGQTLLGPTTQYIVKVDRKKEAPKVVKRQTIR